MKEIVIKSDKGANQIKVVLYPKDKQIKVDFVRLVLKDLEREEQTVDMTPDEALEIAHLLICGVQFYLFTGNKDYKKIIKDRAKIALKRLKSAK